MKKEIKTLIIGLVAGASLASGAAVFASDGELINVIFDKVKVQVNGAALSGKTLLYEDTTYVPIRTAAEAFGASIEYDKATSTANIVSSSKKDTSKIAVADDEDKSKIIYADITAIPTTIEYSDKALSGSRTMTATVSNYSGYTLTDYKATYVNGRNSKVYTIEPGSKISLKYGESFTDSALLPASSFEADLVMTSCTYTLSDGTESVTITYNASTGSYTIDKL